MTHSTPVIRDIRQPRLVLYFDINNTIIMKDQAKAIKSVELNVARIVAKSVWGKVTAAAEETEVATWELVYGELSWSKPETAKRSKGSEEAVELKSYADYLSEVYPTKGADADKNKAIQLERILEFATATGPGAKFKSTQEKMMKCMTLSKAAKELLNFPPELADKVRKGEPLWDEQALAKGSDDDDAELDQDSNQGPSKLSEEDKLKMEMFGEDKFHIIPSFFRTLIFLKKQKRDFSICFRTFGEDLSNVVWEFNQFCSGTHPCYSGVDGTPLIKFDGSQNSRDLRIRENS